MKCYCFSAQNLNETPDIYHQEMETTSNFLGHSVNIIVSVKLCKQRKIKNDVKLKVQSYLYRVERPLGLEQ